MSQNNSTTETKRVAALERSGWLEAPAGIYSDVVRIAASICQTPVAMVILVDKDRLWFTGRLGWDKESVERSPGFVDAVIESRQSLVIPDTLHDPRFSNHPWVEGDPTFRFYAGVPLRARSGEVLGVLCVFDHCPRQLSASQVVALEALARRASGELHSVAPPAADRSRDLDQLSEGMHPANLREVAASVAHQINNPLAIILLKSERLANHLRKGKLDPAELQDGIDKIRMTAERISGVIRRLRRLARNGDSLTEGEDEISPIQ